MAKNKGKMARKLMAKMAIFFAIFAISPWRKSRKNNKWRMAMSPSYGIFWNFRCR
ncbi:MAG: hypothetical protein GY820_31200 [Gammaproteobacteria bacterium]|nr:hypothetical protein [Gammaproteobacteria bacterium]